MKIPKLKSQSAGEVPSMGPMSYAIRESGEMMDKAVRVVAQAGETLGKIYEERKKAGQATALGQARVQFETEYQKEMDVFRQSNPDPDTYLDKANEIHKKIKEKISGNINDMEVKRAFGIAIDMRQVAHMGALAEESKQYWRDTNKASKYTQIEALQRLIAQSSDMDTAIAHKATMRGIIKTMYPFMNKIDVAKLEADAMASADDTMFKNFVRKDPRGALTALRAGAFPNLREPVAYYEKMAEQINDEWEKDIRDKQVKNIVNTMDERFKRPDGKSTDYDEIKKRLVDQTYMKEFGDVHPDVISDVIKKFEERERIAFFEKKKLQEKNANQLVMEARLNPARINTTRIAEMVKNEELNREVGEHIIQLIQNPPEGPPNMKIISDLMREVYFGEQDPTAMTNKILAARQPQGVTMSLLAHVYNNMDNVEKGAMKGAVNNLMKGIVTDNVLNVQGYQQQLFFQAMNALNDKISQERKRLNRPLLPKEIEDLVTQIIPSYQVDVAEIAKILSEEKRSKAKEKQTKAHEALINKQYKSPEEVRDVKDLSYDEKAFILEKQFGIKSLTAEEAREQIGTY